jgi:hypothetical protein
MVCLKMPPPPVISDDLRKSISAILTQDTQLGAAISVFFPTNCEATALNLFSTTLSITLIVPQALSGLSGGTTKFSIVRVSRLRY